VAIIIRLLLRQERLAHVRAPRLLLPDRLRTRHDLR
jgi:hypothetical protein